MRTGQKLILVFICITLLAEFVSGVVLLAQVFSGIAIKHATAISIISTLIAVPAVAVLGYFFYRITAGTASQLGNAASGRSDIDANINSDGEVDGSATSFNDKQYGEKKYPDHSKINARKQQAELSSANAELEQQALTQKKLQHRIKQLDCFYGLSRLIEPADTALEQIFQETTHLIRNAYQYPDITCVRITFDGIQYKTDNFDKSELSQHAEIRIRGDKAGSIEAYYLGERNEDGQSPFLKEESDMLNAVAERLGRVTELKKTGEKLQLIRNLLDGSNDCIFVIEPKWGRFVDVNNRACDNLGYTRKELLGMTLKDIEESVADDFSWQECIEQLERKGDIVTQNWHKRKDGTKYFVETALKLVSRRKEKYIIAIARDISERRIAQEKQAELIQELKSTNKKMESINQELKDFAYIISHDLKAPLRGIKTLADWISTDYRDKLDDNGREQIDLLVARVARMHNLIDGVLQYSRVGRVSEEKTRVNLNQLVPEVIDMVAPPQNITITIEDELPVVECEQTRILQVFENLLSNAIKYMDKPQGQIKVGCLEEDGFWKFSVADNGPGIEEKHFERIFRIFQTLSPRDEFESTGVGLTVIKKIVELYGGRIWVESEVGRGSTFFFTFRKQEKETVNVGLEADITC